MDKRVPVGKNVGPPRHQAQTPMVDLLCLLSLAIMFAFSAVSRIGPGSARNVRRAGLGFGLGCFLLRSTLAMAVTPDSQPTTFPTAPLHVSLNDSTKNATKLGVLLLNLGGPEKIEDVEGFLFNLFADPDIIRLPFLLSPLQKPIAYFIAHRRAPKSSVAYQSIGGGSPIVKYTTAQAKLLQERLVEQGFSKAKTYFAMRYWHPFTEDVLEQIKLDGIEELVILPLYPHYSISTSGSSLKLLHAIFEKAPGTWGVDKVKHTVVPSWYDRPGYLRVMAKLVVEQISTFATSDLKGGVHVLFSAHGVPQSYIEAGDPYKAHIEHCVQLITQEVRAQLLSDAHRPAALSTEAGMMLAGPARECAVEGDELSNATCAAGALPPVEFHLSFQSRVGPVKWLEPYTDDTLKALGTERSVKNLVVVPVSFVSEHIETLEEIDVEYRELAHEHGIVNWRRAAALNTDEGFIEDMADIVEEALTTPRISLPEALALGGKVEAKDSFTGKLTRTLKGLLDKLRL